MMKSKRVKFIFVTVTSLIGGLAIISGIVVVILIFFGRKPTPVSKARHLRQVEMSIAKAGGVSNVLAESKILFQRFAQRPQSDFEWLESSRYFVGLSGLTKLGRNFRYEMAKPDRVEVRVYYDHFDVYFIQLLNPDCPEPAGFNRIAGNVGYMEGNPAFGK